MKAIQYAIKISLVSCLQCIHIEDPYEHVNKYYQYGYQVDDHYTGEGLKEYLCPLIMHLSFSLAAGDYHGHMEHTAGQLTKGEYKVKLPDGRVQVVSYEADHAGFRPRVTYEGVAAAQGVPGNVNKSLAWHVMSRAFHFRASSSRSS